MTQAPLSVRILVEADAPSFRDLRLAAIAEHPDYFGSSHAEEASAEISLFESRIIGSRPGDAAFGLFRGDTMVGVAGMFRTGGETMAHRGHLWGVYVDPSERGGEGAERLIRAVIAHARRHVDVLTGLVTVTNPRARAFYARLGFEFSGIERKILKIGGRYFDQEILVMDLTDASP